MLIFSRRRPKHVRTNLFVSLAVLLGVTILVPIIHTLASPSVGTLHIGTAPKPVATSYKTIQFGKYGHLSVLSDFNILATEDIRLPYVARGSYARGHAPLWQLSLAIRQLPSGNLRDDGTYNYRVLNRKLYKQTEGNVNGQPIEFMTLTTPGQFEKTAYMQHNGLLLTLALSVSSDTDRASIETAYDRMVDLWHWQL